MNNVDKIVDILKENVAKFIWDDRSVSKYRRLAVLSEELGELSASLKGKHEHPPETELIQIAGICINWLNLFYDEERISIAKKYANHED